MVLGLGAISGCKDGVWDCLDGADEGPGHCPSPLCPLPLLVPCLAPLLSPGRLHSHPWPASALVSLLRKGH